MSTHIDAVYVIYDTLSKTFVTQNSKGAWVKAGNAKKAYNQNLYSIWNPDEHKYVDQPRFDEQTRYKIVRLDVSLVETNFLI